jgi:site-specific recombinase XerD
VSWAGLLALYLDHLRALQRAAGTLSQASAMVGRFARFCAERGISAPTEVLVEHAHAFHQRLLWQPGQHGKLYTAHSVHSMLGALCVFFHWAAAHQHLMFDPFEAIVLPHLPTDWHHVPSVQDLERLLEVPDRTTPLGLRDRAILETFYCTGVRHHEGYQLDVDDLDLPGLTLLIRVAKGGTPRLQPIGENLAATLRQYLAQGRPLLVGSALERALFVGRRGKRLHYASFNQLLRTYTAGAGLDKVSPHRLRHAFAMHLIAGGANVQDVSRLLGHRRLESTYVYTRLTPAQLYQEHQRTHPRARRTP